MTPLEVLSIKYEPVYVKRTVSDAVVGRTRWKKKVAEKYIKEFSESIIGKYKGNGYDLIHAHGMPFPAPVGAIAREVADALGIPYVITAHGSDVNFHMADEVLKDIYIEALESASKCIFVSNALLEKAKSYGYSGRNAVVIPNGYDHEIFKPTDKDEIRKGLGIYEEGYKYVGFVGNLIPVKRADKLGEIFRYINQEHPQTRFIVVGEGYLRKEVEEQTKGLEIVFTGRISQEKVAEYMNAMDVMILPSRSEGWPCVVLEAQACGTCVVGSSNGGIPEAVGFNEYVVEDGEDFERRVAHKVIEVLREGYDADKFVNRAEHFKWEEIVEREIHVYEAYSSHIHPMKDLDEN